MRKYDVTDEYFKYYRYSGDLYKIRYTCFSGKTGQTFKFDDYVSGEWIRENIEELTKFHEGVDRKHMDLLQEQCETFMSEKEYNLPDLRMVHYYIEQYISEDGTVYSVSRNNRYSNR